MLDLTITEPFTDVKLSEGERRARRIGRYRHIREAKGLTIREISAELGITDKTWQRWEKGECPSARYLRLLNERTGLSITYLRGD